MNREKGRFLHALIVPLVLLFAMWVIKAVELIIDMRLSFLGVHPLHVDGLAGIVTMPLVHGDMGHLLANSGSFLILCTALFYFYRGISYKVLIGIWLLSGIWVWFGGRDSWHIGASGVIYGLSSFLFFSGLIRRNTQLAALALVVAFLYGSMIWGIFPDFFPKENISWEGHLGGFLAGLILTFYFKDSGPQRKRYSWEFEEEEEEVDDDDHHPKIHPWKHSRDNTDVT